MDSYQIRWKKSARKEVRRLPKSIIPRILDAVENLAESPRPFGSRKLVGSEFTYRIRVGDYRIVYNVYDMEIVVEIVRVAHRKDVYR